jgi:membrane protein DedA with SNARE-associated domain
VLARAAGCPLAVRLVEPRDLDRMELLTRRFGPKTLVLCRALPVLAEASVLLVGAMRLPWLAFFLPVALANLGIALAYSLLGSYSAERGLLLWAIVGAIALPLLATALMRHRLGPSNDDSAGPTTR